MNAATWTETGDHKFNAFATIYIHATSRLGDIDRTRTPKTTCYHLVILQMRYIASTYCCYYAIPKESQPAKLHSKALLLKGPQPHPEGHKIRARLWGC